MNGMTIEMEERGVLRLPKALRSKYRLRKGDDVHLLDLEGYVLLTLGPSRVAELSAHLEKMRKQAGLSEADLLEGLDEQRRSSFREKYSGSS